MGGEVCFAMRDEKGNERVQLRWTNSITSIFFEPTFLTGGEAFKKAWNEGKPDAEWPATKSTNTIVPSEYGVVFVDLRTKKVFSRQNYCDPVVLRIHNEMNMGEVRSLLWHRERGHIVKIETYGNKGVRKLTKKEDKALWEGFEKAVQIVDGDPKRKGKNNLYITIDTSLIITWKPKGFKVDDRKPRKGEGSVRAQNCWEEVLAFLKENKWKSKTEKASSPFRVMRTDLLDV